MIHKNKIAFLMMAGLMGSGGGAQGESAVKTAEASLYAGFAHPIDEYRPRTWWHWMDDKVTQYGITQDLEAMKEVGLKGAQIFFIGGKPAADGNVSMLSPAWLDAVEHAAKESKRLGLRLGSTSSAGVSGSGGPWITPELSMQDLVWRDVRVQGPSRKPSPCHSHISIWTIIAMLQCWRFRPWRMMPGQWPR